MESLFAILAVRPYSHISNEIFFDHTTVHSSLKGWQNLFWLFTIFGYVFSNILMMVLYDMFVFWGFLLPNCFWNIITFTSLKRISVFTLRNLVLSCHWFEELENSRHMPYGSRWCSFYAKQYIKGILVGICLNSHTKHLNYWIVLHKSINSSKNCENQYF